MKTVSRILCFAFLLTGVACKNRAGSSEQRAIISENQKITAIKVLGTIDYLPYAFTKDGCYIRSYIASMELAALQIPSSAIYVQNPDISMEIPWRVGRKGRGDREHYLYHTALLVKGQKDERSVVFDPLLDAKKPLKLREWLLKVLKKGDPYYFYDLIEGSQYAKEVLDGPGNETVTPVKEEPEVKMIRSIKEMRGFRIDSISSACQDAALFWREVKKSRIENPEHPAFPPGPFGEQPCKLRSRLKHLVKLIHARDLLKGSPKNFSCPQLAEMEQEWSCGF